MNYIRILILVLLVYLISYLYKKLWKSGNSKKVNETKNNSLQPEEMMQDPICKTYIPKSQAVLHHEKNKTVFFCSEDCKNKYKKINRK